uniref:RING-type domain-containing protein n=2 Tax=Parascaris univalens TaxID=6257 RepID=A0A915AHU2_PARUN
MTEKKQRRSDTPGFRWIFCNTCGTTATAGAILFVSGCGHIHCSSCLNALAAKVVTSSGKGASTLECSRCRKPMKLQKIDKSLPQNVLNYFLNPNEMMRNVLKSITPIVQFQDNQCRLLNKRIVEIRCKNEQLRTSFMQMAVYKSQLEKQLAVVQGLRPQNESEKGDSGMLQRSLDVSVSTCLSNGKPYRDQKEQQNTPSTLTGSPDVLGLSLSSLPMPQMLNSSVNSSVVSGIADMMKSKKVSQAIALEHRNTAVMSSDSEDRGGVRPSTKFIQQAVSTPRKRDHSGNRPRGAKTVPLRKVVEERVERE